MWRFFASPKRLRVCGDTSRPIGGGGAEGRRRWQVVLSLRVYPHNRFGGALAGPRWRSEGADIVRRLQVSAGRFLPETLGNRRHLPRADVVVSQFYLEVQEMWVSLQ